MISKKLESFRLWFCNQVIAAVYFVYYVFNNIPRYLGYQNGHTDKENMMTRNPDPIDDSDDNDEEVIPENIGIDEPDGHVATEKYLSVKKRIFSHLKSTNKNKPRPETGRRNQIPENVGNIYKLKNPYCVVIGNINFDDQSVPRNGGDADVANIVRLLKDRAGFKTVETHLDCRRIKMLEIIDNIAKYEKTKHHDGLLCFITSHGTSEGIRSVDRNGYVTVDQLTTRLNGKQCKSLLGKPKLFFIQACRGQKTDSGVRPAEGIETDTVVPTTDEMVVPKLPTAADFLICYATTRDNIAYRRYNMGKNEDDMGSWFISVLTKVFSEYMHKEDVMQMMVRVNAEVAGMATGDDHIDGKKEMPCQMHRLRSRVMFAGNNAALQ